MRRYVPKTYKNRRVLRVILGVIIAAAFAAVILFIVLFFSLQRYFDGERLNWPPARDNDPVEAYYEYRNESHTETNGEG
jgi:hypothetical protein